jgi:hypothetical protein
LAMAVILIMVQLLGFTTFLETGYAQQDYTVSYSPCSEGTSSTLKNLDSLDDFINDPSKLKNLTPDELYNYLKNNGYNPQPLSDGSLKGILFEDGGGFKVNWGGDKLLQYHPAGSGHHGGNAYWKLSSGSTGTIRYDMNGNILK